MYISLYLWDLGEKHLSDTENIFIDNYDDDDDDDDVNLYSNDQVLRLTLKCLPNSERHCRAYSRTLSRPSNPVYPPLLMFSFHRSYQS